MSSAMIIDTYLLTLQVFVVPFECKGSLIERASGLPKFSLICFLTTEIDYRTGIAGNIDTQTDTHTHTHTHTHIETESDTLPIEDIGSSNYITDGTFPCWSSTY